MFAAAAIVALLLATLPAGTAQLRRAALASAGVLAIALPWRLYGAGYDLPTADYDLRNLFDPRYLADHADRVGPVVRELGSELTDVGRWGLLPAACVLALVAGLLAARRTVGVFAAAWAVLAFCGLVLTYWLSVLPLASDLSNSSYRTVASIVIGISCLVPLLVDDGVSAGVRMLARARGSDPVRPPTESDAGPTVRLDRTRRRRFSHARIAQAHAHARRRGAGGARADLGHVRGSRVDRLTGSSAPPVTLGSSIAQERHLPQGEVGHARLRPRTCCVALGPAASRDDDAPPRLPLRPREPGQAGRQLFDGGRGEERALDRGRIGSRIGKPRGCLPCSPSGDTPRSATRPLVGYAPGTIRTCDLCLRRAALYPLSYGRGRVSVAVSRGGSRAGAPLRPAPRGGRRPARARRPLRSRPRS